MIGKNRFGDFLSFQIRGGEGNGRVKGCFLGRAVFDFINRKGIALGDHPVGEDPRQLPLTGEQGEGDLLEAVLQGFEGKALVLFLTALIFNFQNAAVLHFKGPAGVFCPGKENFSTGDHIQPLIYGDGDGEGENRHLLPGTPVGEDHLGLTGIFAANAEGCLGRGAQKHFALTAVNAKILDIGDFLVAGLGDPAVAGGRVGFQHQVHTLGGFSLQIRKSSRADG